MLKVKTQFKCGTIRYTTFEYGNNHFVKATDVAASFGYTDPQGAVKTIRNNVKRNNRYNIVLVENPIVKFKGENYIRCKWVALLQSRSNKQPAIIRNVLDRGL